MTPQFYVPSTQYPFGVPRRSPPGGRIIAAKQHSTRGACKATSNPGTHFKGTNQSHRTTPHAPLALSCSLSLYLSLIPSLPFSFSLSLSFSLSFFLPTFPSVLCLFCRLTLFFCHFTGSTFQLTCPFFCFHILSGNRQSVTWMFNTKADR